MDLLEFLSQLTASLAPLCGSCIWPITIFLLILILKKPLLDLLAQLRRVKFGDMFELELARGLEEEAEDAGLVPPITPEAGSEAEELRRLAKVNPRGAVVQAWLFVEDSLRNLAATVDLPAERVPVGRLLTQLSQREVVEPELVSVIKELKHVRNLAAHDRTYQVREEVFLPSYIDITLRVLQRLEAIRSGFSQAPDDESQSTADLSLEMA